MSSLVQTRIRRHIITTQQHAQLNTEAPKDKNTRCHSEISGEATVVVVFPIGAAVSQKAEV